MIFLIKKIVLQAFNSYIRATSSGSKQIIYGHCSWSNSPFSFLIYAVGKLLYCKDGWLIPQRGTCFANDDILTLAGVDAWFLILNIFSNGPLNFALN